MRALALVLCAVVLVGCPPPPSPPTPGPAPDAGAAASTHVQVSNATDAGAVVNVSFGTDSTVKGWAFCTPTSSGCTFSLPASSTQPLATGGQYLNASIAFNAPVGCGATIAELTANNANGYGTADVSLVNGWNADVAITVDGLTLGPAVDGGNASTFGVFPYGCDVCVARSSPPCGIPSTGCTAPGSCGCKAGSQYKPAVPCQATYQRADAGSTLTVELRP